MIYIKNIYNKYEIYITLVSVNRPRYRLISLPIFIFIEFNSEEHMMKYLYVGYLYVINFIILEIVELFPI